MTRRRIAAIVASLVATASLAAGGHAAQPSSNWTAAPPPCEDWGCGTNHNAVMATTVA